jgi:hypothetical protein
MFASFLINKTGMDIFVHLCILVHCFLGAVLRNGIVEFVSFKAFQSIMSNFLPSGLFQSPIPPAERTSHPYIRLVQHRTRLRFGRQWAKPQEAGAVSSLGEELYDAGRSPVKSSMVKGN